MIGNDAGEKKYVLSVLRSRVVYRRSNSMKFDKDEKITWYLLTLIWSSAFWLFLYGLINQAYA
jgi:hypothetical protein